MIPFSLVAAYRSLPWDDRGLLSELPAGDIRTWSNTHTDFGNPYGQPIDQHGPDTPYGAFGKVMLHNRIIPDAWMIEAIPPAGTAVWQIKGQTLHIIRTSEIESYMRGGFVHARLKAAGPYPGIPIGGDSGSICFVRHRGRWQVLGICNLAGTCSLPFWDLSLPTNKGSSIPPRNNEAKDPENWSKSFYEPDETLMPMNRELILQPCPTTKRVVSIYTEGDDGTDNIVLEIANPPNIIFSLAVLGAGTDKWAWPDNGVNWIVRAGKTPNGSMRLWLKESRPTSSYTVWIDSQQFECRPLASLDGAPEPAPTAPHVTDELEAKIRQLTADNAALAMANGDLRTQLNAEIVAHGETKAKISRFLDALSELRN